MVSPTTGHLFPTESPASVVAGVDARQPRLDENARPVFVVYPEEMPEMEEVEAEEVDIEEEEEES